MIRLLLLLALLFPIPSMADDLPPSLAGLLHAYEKSKGFTCRFVQQILFEDGSSSQYEGTLAVLRPQRFRWEYTKPYAQIYIGDGRKVWHYEPDLMQVQVGKSLEAVDPAVMRLLSGEIRQEQIHMIRATGETEYQLQVDEGPTIRLGIDLQGNLAFLETRDALGNRNLIRFYAWQFSPPPVQWFEFKAPEGVDIVEFD